MPHSNSTKNKVHSILSRVNLPYAFVIWKQDCKGSRKMVLQMNTKFIQEHFMCTLSSKNLLYSSLKLHFKLLQNNFYQYWKYNNNFSIKKLQKKQTSD